MTTTQRASALAAVVLFAAGSAVATAQSRPYGDAPRTYGDELYRAMQMPTPSPNNQYSDYPAAEVQSVPAARARTAIAHMESLRAQAELNRGTRAVIRVFSKSEDMTKATAEEKEAYAQYQSARERALQPLESDARYQALSQWRKALGEQIAEKHAKGQPIIEEILSLAGVKLQYSHSLTLKEAELLRNSSEVTAARTRLLAATTKLTDLRARFDEDVRQDPDLIAARRAVWDSKVAHVAASAYFSGLVEARGIALDYAYYSRRYNPYRVMGYDPYGFNLYNYAYGNGYRY